METFIELNQSLLLELFQCIVNFLYVKVEPTGEFKNVEIETFPFSTAKPQVIVIGQRLVDTLPVLDGGMRPLHLGVQGLDIGSVINQRCVRTYDVPTCPPRFLII